MQGHLVVTDFGCSKVHDDKAQVCQKEPYITRKRALYNPQKSPISPVNERYIF